MESLDKTMTEILLQGEKNLITKPNPFISTTIEKRQVAFILLLKNLQRLFYKHQDTSSTIRKFKSNEFLYDVTPESLPT